VRQRQGHGRHSRTEWRKKDEERVQIGKRQAAVLGERTQTGSWTQNRDISHEMICNKERKSKKGQRDENNRDWDEEKGLRDDKKEQRLGQ
jgi:hypothetical protein